MTEVLPSLQSLFLEDIRVMAGPFREFVAACQLSGHQIAISHWDVKHDPWLEHKDA